jgi:hypothetical protein
MPTEFDPQLERLVHQELRQLPLRKAPGTLAPRVLAAIQARAARPWWQQSWWHWPLLAQLALLGLALSIIAGFSGGGWFVVNQAAVYSQMAWDRVVLLGDGLAPLGNAGLLLYDRFFHPYLLYALMLAGMLYCGCLGAGTVLVRIAVRRI